MQTVSDLAAGLEQAVGDGSRVLTQPQAVERLSRDFYWYSPVLKALLDDKRADAVVQPVGVAEVCAVLRCCYAQQVPVTVRGAGTGNYGQAVPLNGGVVLDLQRMDRIEDIGPDGVAVCEPGVKLGQLESAAREQGWELRCYPSTIAKASLGGFLGGGSGGIGSVKHGGLRDFGTVRALEVVTMEAEPRVVLREGAAVHEILHAWGTNGVITRIWFALAPAVAWSQVALSFKSFAAAFDFSEAIAKDAAWDKRLITVFEPRYREFFAPVKACVCAGEAAIFLMIAKTQEAALEAAAKTAGATVTLAAPWTGLKSQPLLSDYTWNHTTLWAMKADAAYTYLQCGFRAEDARAQFAKLKARYGDDFLLHIEWMKNGEGVVIPAAIPVVRYSTEERLNEMIDFCREIGVFVANPHVNNVEGGGRYRADNVQLQAKYKYDARGLMNPGKMVSFVKQEVEQTA